MFEVSESLIDGSPLIKAAQMGKLRLVRLLLEGGAHVNECNEKGETPLMQVCKARRDDPLSHTLKLTRYLLDNNADPNIQDKMGRTALMHACIAQVGAEIMSVLLSLGADPCMEDYNGMSALVYAINAKDDKTVKVLLDACNERGRDVIIISKDMTSSGRSIAKQYLNVPPSPDFEGRTSPVSCMSPSEIELKTGSPCSDTDGDNIFNFRVATHKEYNIPLANEREEEPLESFNSKTRTPHQQRLHSEPWLAIRNLSELQLTYEHHLDENTQKEENLFSGLKSLSALRRPSLRKIHSMESPESLLTETPKTSMGPPQWAKRKFPFEKVPRSGQILASGGRRNTLPTEQHQKFLQLPSLAVTGEQCRSDSYLPVIGSTSSIPAKQELVTMVQGQKYHTSISTHSLHLTSTDMFEDDLGKETKSQLEKKVFEGSPVLPSQCRSNFLPPLAVPLPLQKPKSCVSKWVTSSTSSGEALKVPRSSLSNLAKSSGARIRTILRRHSIQVEQMKSTGYEEEVPMQ
ncbi:ankyrin repeat domain-containing protein 34C-like [Polypterus senegalus]|nr:ankyrin repeat domain-containing protein 34C-like [Polypterus senegalus]